MSKTKDHVIDLLNTKQEWPPFKPSENQNLINCLKKEGVYRFDDKADDLMEVIRDLFSADSQLEDSKLRLGTSMFIVSIYASFGEYSDLLETDKSTNLVAILMQNELFTPEIIAGMLDATIYDLTTSINSVDGEQRANNAFILFDLRDAFRAYLRERSVA